MASKHQQHERFQLLSMSEIDARTIDCLRREELWNVVPEDRALLLLVDKHYIVFVCM